MATTTQQTQTMPVEIAIGPVVLAGDLTMPAHARGVVLFAHGSASSRFSPRNRFVADVLQASSLATLLIDLLTAQEERIDQYCAELRFDIPMLAERLLTAIEWLDAHPNTQNLPIGLLGA